MSDTAFVACFRVNELLHPHPASVVLPCEDCLAPMWVHPHSIEIQLTEHAALLCADCANARIRASGEPAYLAIHPLQEPEFTEQLRALGAWTKEEVEEHERRGGNKPR